jgi:hypothetical protein
MPLDIRTVRQGPRRLEGKPPYLSLTKSYGRDVCPQASAIRGRDLGGLRAVKAEDMGYKCARTWVTLLGAF